MSKTGAAAIALIVLLAPFLYTLLVYLGAAPLPQQLTPLYQAVKPLYEKILGPRQQAPEPQAPQTPSRPPVCLLEARNGTGYTVYLVKTGGRCPSAWSYRVVPRHGWRIASITLHTANRTASLNATGSLIIYGNASLVVEAERVYVSVRILVNASAPYLVNGTEHKGPTTLRVPLGSLIVIKAKPQKAGVGSYIPLNSTVVYTADQNTTLRLYWAYRINYTCKPGEIWIITNLRENVTAYINGKPVQLPTCIRPPVVVEGVFAGPAINGTHRYWLGWYWVEEGGRRWWWSYGINGSRLRVEGPANITLYYLPGLKGLPYVERVVEFPEGFFNGSCPLNPGKAVEDWEVRDGWLHVYNPRPCNFEGENTRITRLIATMRISRKIKFVEIEVRVPEWNGRNYYDESWIYVAIQSGGTVFYLIPELEIYCKNCAPRAETTRILFDGYKVYRVRPEWGKIHIFGGSFNMYGFVEDWQNHFWKFPNNGQYVFVGVGSYYRLTHEFYVRVVGVTPCEGC